jgi:bacillithiol synthase
MLNYKETVARKFYYNNLFYDFIFNFEKIADHFFYDYRKKEDFKKSAEYIASGSGYVPGHEIYGALADYNLSCGCPDETVENIEHLKNGAFAVVTGQQPGLLSGPIFNIYKAITVLKISSFLSGYLKMKVVPVFWNASDDSNTGQIDALNVISRGALKESRFQLPDDKRFSDIEIDPAAIREFIVNFTAGLNLTENTENIRNFLTCALKSIKNRRCPGPNYIFSSVMLKFFGKNGLVVIDPCIPELKKNSVELAKADIDNSDKVKNALKEEGVKLSAKDFHNQIDYYDDSLDFFITEDGLRRKVYRKGKDKFGYKNEILSKNDLVDMVEKNPGVLSLNVVLRCILQDTLLPNVCSVCGPGEVSYFAQIKSVYHIFNRRTGVIYPRISATVVEKTVASEFEKLHLNFEDVSKDMDCLKKQVLLSGNGLDAKMLFRDFETDILKKTQELKNSLGKMGIDTENAFNRIKENVSKEIDKLSRKVINENDRKNLQAAKGLEKIYLNILPQNLMQERKISIFNYINKYGFSFVDDLFEGLDIHTFPHKIVYLQ